MTHNFIPLRVSQKIILITVVQAFLCREAAENCDESHFCSGYRSGALSDAQDTNATTGNAHDRSSPKYGLSAKNTIISERF